MRTPKERAALGVELPLKRKPRQKAADPENPIVTKTKDQKDEPLSDGVADQALLEADGDILDIWERRMLNPDQRKSEPIRVKTAGLHLRWINLAANGRYQRARYEEGWQPLQKKELVDEREIYGVSYTNEGFVCRGEKQQEMLMFIPEYIWKKIRQAKIDQVHKSQAKIKESLTSSAASHFTDKYGARGEEIADRLSTFKGDIKFGKENVQPDDDEEAMVRAGFGA